MKVSTGIGLQATLRTSLYPSRDLQYQKLTSSNSMSVCRNNNSTVTGLIKSHKISFATKPMLRILETAKRYMLKKWMIKSNNWNSKTRYSKSRSIVTGVKGLSRGCFTITKKIHVFRLSPFLTMKISRLQWESRQLNRTNK